MSRAPLLTKVYRWGPARQRLAKGYVLAGANVQQLRDTVVGASQALAQQQGVTLRVDERANHAVWLDTGLIWLHTTSERERWASQLSRVVKELARHAETAGGRLLPNATRMEAVDSWANLTCGDEHYVETSSELEKTAYCNLLRLHLPELIALTGR
ncbi:MAG TPA: hypothetical protein VFU02_14005, partial [Polyangiaceae bacterium]|nr:hypothetical protein [Polyangiaceae bacterium]